MVSNRVCAMTLEEILEIVLASIIGFFLVVVLGYNIYYRIRHKGSNENS